jgi:alkylated DNA repair dioxygenase AlkB
MNQLSLFVDEVPKPYTYFPDFLSKHDADAINLHCQGLNWSQKTITRFGFVTPNPRLECLYGRPKITYKYGGEIILIAEKWTEVLYHLAANIAEHTGYNFQYCIGNLYRDGDDSIGWHADNDSSMGPNPAIASISLGQMRLFQIKKIGSDAKPESIWLEHGSLLLMKPGMQQTHVHRVPKVTKGWCGERINLTFRPHKNE